jgi:hypothetical protein
MEFVHFYRRKAAPGTARAVPGAINLYERLPKAFSREVESTSREENASF